MISALALACITAAQPQTVTFTHPCAHSSVVLEALGKELNLTLKPSGSVNKDYFLVSFKEVPVKQAFDKIAETLNATWTQKSGVYYLGRTRAQEISEHKAAVAENAALIENWLSERDVEAEYTADRAKKLLADLALLVESGAAEDPVRYESLSALGDQAPLARCLYRLMREIGFANLADVPEGEDVQYVLNPNPSQRQLPRGNALRIFEQENTVHKAVLEESGLLDRLAANAYYSPLTSPYLRSTFNRGQTMLSVLRNEGTFQIWLRIGGVGRYTTYVSVWQSAGADLPDELTKQSGEYSPTPIEKRMGEQAFLLFGGNGLDVQPPVSEIAEVLADPLKNEPLSIFGSGWILAAAEGLGRNVVAVLSDEASFAAIATLAQRRTQFNQYWANFSRFGRGYRAELDGEWLLLYPKDAASVREDRVDRAAWRSLIRSHVKGGLPSLEELAGYAALSDNQTSVQLALINVPFIFGDMPLLNAFSRGNIDVLRLYGRLTDEQRRQARAGGVELLLSRLPSGLVKPARKLVFGRSTAVEKERRESEWDDPNMAVGGRDNSDPTLVLGGGLPPGSSVRVSVIARDLVYGLVDAGSRQEGVSPDRLAQRIVFADVWPDQGSTQRGFYTVATAKQVVVEFAFPETGFVYARSQIDLVPKDAVYKPVAELPEPFRSEIEKSIAKYREAYKKVKKDGGGA